MANVLSNILVCGQLLLGKKHCEKLVGALYNGATRSGKLKGMIYNRMKKFSIGIIGCGLIARDHCLSLSRLPEVSALSFYDADQLRAQKLADEFGGQSTLSLRALVENCDVIWICTPPFARREAIELASELGRAIFCEKPLAVTREDFHWIQKVVHDSSAPFFMGQSNRFGSYFQKMHELAGDGAVGEITALLSTRLGYLDAQSTPAWRLDDDQSGGTIVELGIHEIDFRAGSAAIGKASTRAVHRVRCCQENFRIRCEPWARCKTARPFSLI